MGTSGHRWNGRDGFNGGDLGVEMRGRRGDLWVGIAHDIYCMSTPYQPSILEQPHPMIFFYVVVLQDTL